MPAIAFGTPTWVDEVLDLVEARVADGSGLPRDKVFSYAGEPADLAGTPPGEKFIACWFTGLPVMPGYVAGGGAAHTAFDSTLRLDVFVRLGTDKQLQDTKLLRDASHGFAKLVRRTVKAVQVWHGVAAGADSSPFIEPTRMVGPGVAFNPRTPPTGWGWARVTLGVKFRTDFTV